MSYKKISIKELIENLNLSIIAEDEEKLIVELIKREEEILSEMKDIFHLYENEQKKKLRLIEELNKLVENNRI
jgi:predicted DNA-binding protein YlxM (UPF0122 family)